MSGEYVDGALYDITANLQGWQEERTFRAVVEGGRFRMLDGTGTSIHFDNPYISSLSPLRVLAPDERVVEPGQPVLDLTDESLFGCWAAEHGTKWIVDALNMTDSLAAQAIARQIEAQTKPPRIPEPGFGTVVIAGVKQHDQRLRWVRVTPLNDTSKAYWYCEDANEYPRTWEQLLDPQAEGES